MSVPGFVFVDLETSAVDNPATEAIFEIGFALYSLDFEPIDRFEILPVTTGTAAAIDKVRTDPEYAFVAKMHTDNGLFADLERAIAAGPPPADMSGYQAQIVESLTRWGVDSSTELAGSSLRMDRAFLKQWLPEVDALFSFRIVDASSFRAVRMKRDPERTQTLLDRVAECGGATHRVAADIHHSANLLRVFEAGSDPIPFVEVDRTAPLTAGQCR
ncbi:oligoribonuclease [Rhodococcus sp. Br-6]|nr:oligoribonuclease [Rhodococcus sp. Br-6]